MVDGKIIGWDTETDLIKPGCGAPKLACVTFSESGDRGAGQILGAEDGMKWLRNEMEGHNILTAHHAPYDLGVACAESRDMIELVFDKIDRGELACTLLRQKIIQNALGTLKYEWDEELEQFKAQRFGLAYVALRLLGRERDKGADTYRLRYRELMHKPVEQWPQEAIDYAVFDAEDTRAIYGYQNSLEKNITGENWQMEAAWALHLASLWGIRTDPERVARIKEQFFTQWDRHLKIAQEYGFVRDDKKQSKDTKAIAAAVRSWFEQNDAGPVPETPTGKVSLKREVLIGTDHEGLLAVAEMGKWRKRLTTYIPVLETGTRVPINPSFNAILETFRTSCRQPNVQNLPRQGGMRECFVARDYTLFCFSDYDTLEMRSLAQVCLDLFNESAMAEALREGKDLHLDMAAQLAGCTYEEAVARKKSGDKEILALRQHSKPANFGFPGGMGAMKFILYAAQYGVVLTLSEAKALRETFMSKWPEMHMYFEYCAGLVGGESAHSVEFLRSGMLRGDVTYTAVCNGFFQHLAAMGAKQALYRVSKACYTDKNSPLFGCRPHGAGFLHDEIGIEIPVRRCDPHDAAMELQRLMNTTMSEWIPDVPITSGAALMKRWYKGAEPVYHNERLVPCKPTSDGWTMDA